MNAHVDEHAQHACYSPSSAHRWTVCTASATAIAQLGEQEEGEAAAKGTAAHEELERVLSGGEPDVDHPSAYGVALAVNYIKQLPPGKLWVEQRVHLTDQIWGRTDVTHFDEQNRTLTVLDLKDGFVDVDVVENDQERIYGAGSIYTHKLAVDWIRYVIVQPNSITPGPRVKQWMESAESLFEWANKVAAIPRGELKFVAGTQCTYCPLFGKCEASKDLLKNVGALVAGLMSPEDVTPAQRALFKACEKPIKDAFAKADKVWTKDAMAKGAPDGMKIVTALKHKAWKDEAAARALVLERLGPEALDVPTPAQAIERGIPEDLVNAMAPRPEGAPVLAFASDKRPEWKQKSATEMFAGVVGK